MSFTAPLVDSEELVKLIRDPTKQVGIDYVIVDVRDQDFIGGNIPGALNIPANQIVDSATELVQKYSKVPEIYFHCALSQVRGPKSARIYKEYLHLQGITTDQQVKVIRGGFEGWQQKYKDEKDLIENYDPELWANGW
ncbi:Rhodanese-like domain-containing protein [Halteromyces radiatus]|uniref:Rhodanese-like domain-containing protein n=1 Tax=Halteromyces radiatus TaxID=101107 RepID=UPI00221E7EF3|nr:Rhodanese-like domain-containing protein [Halteromyces radiatus]KAI8089189.1 Rhodanese-like domain-containing protein [Halteromyces radiatus]